MAEKHISLQELHDVMKSDDTELPVGDLEHAMRSRKRLERKSSLLRRHGRSSFRLSWKVDIDSIDALTVAFGGPAFGVSTVEVVKTFELFTSAPSRSILSFKKEQQLEQGI